MKKKFEELARLLSQVETILSEIKKEARGLSIKHNASSVKTRENFVQKTSREFVEWCETDPFPFGERIHRPEYLAKLIEFSPNMSFVTPKRFALWLKIYCDHKQLVHFIGKSNERRFSLIYESIGQDPDGN